MRIDSGTIGMDSARTYSSFEAKSRRFSAYSKQEALENNPFGGYLDPDTAKEDSKPDDEKNNQISSEGVGVTDTLEQLQSKVARVRSKNITEEQSVEDQFKQLREQLINLLIRLLFPDKKELFADENTVEGTTAGYLDLTGKASGRLSENIVHLSYESSYYYEEYEETTFEAKGIVNCKDGRSFDFNIDISMSRSFAEYYAEEIDFLEVSFTDPLVINFDGNLTGVSDQTFYFDIDSDGVEDEISKLVSGCGFLGLDLNEDGIINDGSELFGTKSGNGFKDLAVYDTDRDGFIDEDDEIFDKLRIWTVDEDGNSHLYSLKDKNIGAIYLGSASTEFSLNSLEDNTTNAQIRSTGVFLFENGNVGNISQIDFARHQRAQAAYA